MTPEQIARAFNDHGVPLIRDEDEIPERDEDVDESSPYRHDWPEMPLGVTRG